MKWLSKGLCLGVLLLGLLGASTVHAKKVVILGIDGLDPRLLDRYMSEGVMPNFSRLAKEGDYKPLQTMMAPQSPVAWSTFITGMDPGGHGIYDFVHRDPATMLPYLSMSRAIPAGRSLGIGTWVLPLSGGKVELLRKGVAFWEVLGEKGIPSIVFRMPVNFPPVEHPGVALSGMGTPDVLGTPGTFSFYTERMPENADEFSGGKAYQVDVIDNRVEAELRGPKNPFRRVRESAGYENPDCKVGFKVFIDPQANAAKFVVGDEEFILMEKEWSDWIRIDFEAVPWLVHFSSIGRFYLKQIKPHFELYVTPLQINPEDPVMPISHPEGWSKELCACVGYFYTQELPEDTKALTHGVFTGRDFWDQAMFIYEERMRALRYTLQHHKEGLLFFYFMTVDQGCHMLWRYTDPEHPGFIDDVFLLHGIRKIYERMDKTLGVVLESMEDDTVLIVMSDHGFRPFYWGVNLNTWLLEKGYIQLKKPEEQGKHKFYANVDWKQTKAYALGLNGLYVNRKGRERNGIVSSAEASQLLNRLEADLTAMRDPRNGRRAVTLVTRPRRDFHGPYKGDGPDILVGYNAAYRSSWESPLGEFPKEVFVDNLEAWSGDHCIDNRLVPGVLLTNRKITLEAPVLYDLTVGVLDEFGVEPLPEMIGRDCLGKPEKKMQSTRPDGQRTVHLESE